MLKTNKPKKRNYLTAFGNTYGLPNIIKKTLKKDNNVELIINKIKSVHISEEEVKITKIYNFEYLIKLLYAKIFTKYNLYYERYLANINPTNQKNNNTKSHSSSLNNITNPDINNNNNNYIKKLNSNNNNNSNSPNNHIILNTENKYNEKYYINSELYPIFRNYKNINPKNIVSYNTIGDGNCLFRAFAYFINKDESKYKEVRNQIYNEGQKRKTVIPNILIDTERGRMFIHDYIDIINEDRLFGGDLEISLAYDIFKFNIAIYKEERDINNNLFNLSFMHYINNDNNEKKDLCILTTIYNNHYNLLFYENNKEPLDLNYIPDLNKSLAYNENNNQNNIEENDNKSKKEIEKDKYEFNNSNYNNFNNI